MSGANSDSAGANAKAKTPEMEGFYVLDQNATEGDARIYLFEIMSELSATSLILSEYDDHDDRENGLRQAVRVLVTLLKSRYTGEHVVKAPRPRLPAGARPPTFEPPRKRKARPTPVVSLVQSPDPAARGAAYSDVERNAVMTQLEARAKAMANPFRLTNGCINGSVLAFMMLVGCTTTQEIKRPNGAVEYVIACGAGSGWNVCYHNANEICPTGYTTVSEDAGFNRKELHIACPKPLSPN